MQSPGLGPHDKGWMPSELYSGSPGAPRPLERAQHSTVQAMVADTGTGEFQAVAVIKTQREALHLGTGQVLLKGEGMKRILASASSAKSDIWDSVGIHGRGAGHQ